MVAAALNQRSLPHGAAAPFAHGDLLHQFSKGGVLEQTPIPNFELLSIQDILRTENHLGHTTDNIHEIDFALLNRTNKQNDFHEHEVFQYSQKETGREQNGGSADADVTTDTGHIKRGIQDPDAFNKLEAKKTRRTIAFLQELEAQRTAMDALNQRIAELEAEIRELDKKLEDLNHEFEEMNEASSFLEDGGDLNDGSPRAARAKRALSIAAARNGIPEDQYKYADGTYNNEAAARIIQEGQQSVAEEAIETEEVRTDKADELREAHKERYALADEMMNNPEISDAQRNELTGIQQTSKQEIQTLEVQQEEPSPMMDKMKAFMERSKNNIVSFYNGDEEENEPEKLAESSNIDELTEEQTQVVAENNNDASSSNNAVSFAAAEDGSVTNVIKPSFNEVSDPVLAQEKLDLAAIQSSSSLDKTTLTSSQDNLANISVTA